MKSGAVVAHRTGGIVEIRAGRCFASQVGYNAPTHGGLAVALDCIWIADGDDELALAKSGSVADRNCGEAAGNGVRWGARSPRRTRLCIDRQYGQPAAWVGGADRSGERRAIRRGDCALAAVVTGQILREYEP